MSQTTLFTSLFLTALGSLIAGVVLMSWEPQLVLEIEGATCWGQKDDEQRLLSCANRAAHKSLTYAIWLKLDEQVIELQPKQLGFTLDETSFNSQAKAVLTEEWQQSSSLSARVTGLFGGVPRERVLSVSANFDGLKAEKTLKFLAPSIFSEPRDAKLLIAEHRVEHAVAGRRLSVPATLARLELRGWQPQLVIAAAVDTIEPEIHERDLTPVDITRVLSAYETSFKGKAGPRGRNIRVAARYLNGAVIQPGETLSFNKVVGHRVHGRGFVDAPVIVNDELEQDVGGGVCQVTTTLHGAAVFGHLDVVRRRSHSRPSGYAPIGLDATVIDGKVDYRIRNPYDEPLLVHAFFPERYIMRVELLGVEPEYKVKHSVSTEKSDGFARRIYFRPEQAPGTFKQKQKGREGMNVTSILSITDKNGKLSRRRYASRYYPVPEVFWVGQGVKPSELPPLPEGGTGWLVEGQPAQVLDSGTIEAVPELPAEELRSPTLEPDPEQVQL